MKVLRLIVCLCLLLSSCSSLRTEEVSKTLSGDTVSIGFAEPLLNYSPLSYEAQNRRYLANMYEALIRFDSSFGLQTSLAVSWGRVEDTVWDFRLREGVVFHDGSSLDAEDVLYSLHMVRDQEESDLAALLSTIVNIEKIDDSNVRITTSVPDPLLPSKLTFLYIFPSAYTDFDQPDGTGPYHFTEAKEDVLYLDRFDDYWGALPYFQRAELHYIQDPEARLEAMKNRQIQVLANVPPQYIDQFREEGINILDFPSLEVGMFMLNQNGILADAHLRSALWNALGSLYVDELGRGYLSPLSQFAATGIFGYNVKLPFRTQNLAVAQEFRDFVPGEVHLNVYLPEELEALGPFIEQDLKAIDIDITLRTIPVEDYEETIVAGAPDLYFFGWKYDLADIGDFLNAVVHSPTGTYGTFNFFGYHNPDLDFMIEQASTLLNTGERRLTLEQISDIALQDRAIIPLFESRMAYAISSSVHYNFRMDGQILASEITETVVK